MSSTKLGTIVAVDVDGFSELAAADANAAVAAVVQLVERCRYEASAHGGRIFDTSGDSVLMEFTNVASAVHAAAELAAEPDPPIRIGVHLGEVSELPSGDLIGHGVTVAGLLQAEANAGRVIVSDAAWRTLRGPAADRFRPKGSIKYDKSNETIRYHELQSGAAADPARRRMRLALAIGAGVAAVVAFALIATIVGGDPPVRAAILPLAAPNEDALQGLASGIAEDITLAAEARALNPIARGSAPRGSRDEQLDAARRADAPYALVGSIERQQSAVRVTMELARTSDRAALWSQTFDSAAPDAALRHRVAIASADVLACGMHAARARDVDDAALALFFSACADARDAERLFDVRERLAQVTERAPAFTVAQSMLALATARASESASNSRRDELRADARALAERALRRDRAAGDAYLALERVERHRGWDAREGILLRAVERDDRNADLNERYAAFLFEVGRSGEAIERARNASTLDPLSLAKRHTVIGSLLHMGDADGARDLIEREARQFPNDPDLWALRFRHAQWDGSANDAVALLDAPESQIRSVRARQCWRDAIAAADSAPQSPAREASLPRVMECSRSGDLPAGQSLVLFSRLGALDEAFALAQTHFVDEQRGGEDILFSEPARPMRVDPRFMALTREIGLLGYWRLSDRWPDFCREPSLPYSCEAEAQRLL